MTSSPRRRRRVYSVKEELLQKSREAALAAVQIFNNPNIKFKSEIYVVLMNIAWTYLLHAYYRSQEIEYRYFKLVNVRRKFDRTKHGAYKYWEIERCLNCRNSPIDNITASNLRFLIGLRHEIEHQMTSRIDDSLSARYQACCVNYNDYIVRLFGEKYGIDRYLSFSLQFSSLSDEQIECMDEYTDFPSNIQKFIKGFDSELSDDDFNDSKYAYRVLFVAKTANTKGQADRVIEFVKSDTEMARGINAQYTVIKEIEKNKTLPGKIVEMMQAEGFPNFKIHNHTELWKNKDARNTAYGFGTTVERTWYWYDRWIEFVRKHCLESGERYK